MELQGRLSAAIKHFWSVREKQGVAQNARGTVDQGTRSQVTGGAQMDGLVELVRDALCERSCKPEEVRIKTKLELPGYFRPNKQWDLIVIKDRRLIAAIEFKSQIGSFGNNVNNRAEEAIGNGVDLHKAYEHGRFHKGPPKPWLGYLFLLEDAPGAKRAVSNPAPYFKPAPEFEGASYQRRYELLCEHLVQDDIYQGACFLMSSKETGPKGKYSEPNPKLAFEQFVKHLVAYVEASA